MTTENNKIIAEFMNFPKITNVRDSESGKYYDYRLPNSFNLILEQEIQIESNNGWGLVHQDYVFVRDLIFHSDWNWLMEVVEKIEGLGNHGFTIYRKTTNINGLPIELANTRKSTKIESVHSACVDFIKWYNNQNKV